MNQIHRLIFSKAKGCLVAFAENVTGQGKGKRKSTQIGKSSETILNSALLKSIPSQQKLLHLLVCAGLNSTGLWTQQTFVSLSNFGSKHTRFKVKALPQLIAGAFIFYSPISRADTFIATIESAGIQQSTSAFSSAGMEAFDTATSTSFITNFGTKLGTVPLVTGISGVVTAGSISNPDMFGGAGGIGKYASGGGTLSLNTPVNYFGVWISALDTNRITFYDQSGAGRNELYTFSTQTMQGLLGTSSASNAYFGNPNYANRSSVNGGEAYAFVNFYNTTGTFSYITLTEGGFESDNWTVGNYTSISGKNPSAGDIVSSTNSTNLVSKLNILINPVFDGGKLLVDTTGANINSNFTIKKNSSGAIDQGGNKTSTFSGNFTDDAGAGTPSKLTITNSGLSSGATNGSVTLSGVNTYTGGTKVEAGATLAITNKDAISTGTLNLVGSATVSANFVALSSMTITNPITVSGDPTFTANPGTTLTLGTVIADGNDGGTPPTPVAGEVVIGPSPGNPGGGTIVMTAINTYTGNTTVDAGNTLVLSGNGSIATSGTDPTIGTGVFNNGTFNIAPATSNTISLGKNYTQSGTGTLAMNWYQKLSIAGSASLAGTLTLLNSNSSTFSLGRYSLLTASGGLSGSFSSLNTTNLSSNYSYSLSYDANGTYFTIAPSFDYTQKSIVATAAALQNTFALQNAVLANSFSYDCNEFGSNGVCISAGGRNTAVSAANGLNNTSGLLIAAYRPHPNYRVGAYADQNLSVNNAGSTVNLSNSTPLIGLFGAWNERVDDTGTEVKVSAAYGQKNTTINRQVVGASEPGSGSSQLNSQGAQVTTKYGFAVTDKAIVSPYIGMRYTQNNMNGYTEGVSSTVTAPLTYSALNTNATIALAGVGVSYKVIPTVTTFASAGVETDTNTANGSYSGKNATIAGLTPVNFNANPVKTRPTAMLGASYEIEKNQRLGITGIYRQESYQAVSTTSVMATYTVGL